MDRGRQGPPADLHHPQAGQTFRAQLLVAAREGIPFRIADGLPQSLSQPKAARTWLEHAMDYVSTKWAHASPRHRRGIAEALTDITMALVDPTQAPMSETELRHALYRHAFNMTARSTEPSTQDAQAMAWLLRHGPALDQLDDAATLRALMNQLALRRDGKPAAASTVTRKRATLHSVLEYAVELEQFPNNPLNRVRWKAPLTTDVVDQRVVVNPAQARALLAAVWESDPALAAYFACLYYAGLRPGEARNLRAEDCTLPDDGWGSLLLTGSHQTSGSAWTDGASSGEDCGPKHRGRQDSRLVPAHPELVRALRRHLDSFQVGRDGRTVRRPHRQSRGADLTALRQPRLYGHRLPRLAQGPPSRPRRTTGRVPARPPAL